MQPVPDPAGAGGGPCPHCPGCSAVVVSGDPQHPHQRALHWGRHAGQNLYHRLHQQTGEEEQRRAGPELCGEQPPRHHPQGAVLPGTGGDDPTGQQAEGDAENWQDGAGQILGQIRPLRAAGVRGVWDPLQAGDLGQERKKADRLAVHLPTGIWNEILP